MLGMISKCSVYPSAVLMQQLEFFYKALKILIYFSGIRYEGRIFHRIDLCTLSNAFWKLVKFTVALWNLISCSIMFRHVNIYSLQERLLRKPACSSCRVRSASVCSLFSKALQNTFPGTESSVILLQLLQSLKSPFLGGFTIILLSILPASFLSAKFH